MDNDSAHECAAKLLKEDASFSLQNTWIEFLPANTISLFQPLDQGIIKNFKTFYQQYWLQFMIDASLLNKNSVKKINMFWVCQWIVSAWNEIQSFIIDHCWCKSTLLDSYQEAQHWLTDYHDNIVHDIQQLGEQLRQAGRIGRLSININDFIDPIEEATTEEPEDIIEHIAAQFGPEWDAESDEEDIEQPKIKISEAYTALQLLRLFEEQQKDEDSSVLSFLNKYEQQIRERRMRESQQRPITAFFSANK